MFNRKVSFSALAVLAFAFIACAPGSRGAKGGAADDSPTQPVAAEDGSVRMSIPASWSVVTGLNDIASIQVANTAEDVYGMVISETAEDFADFPAYSKLAFESFTENIESPRITGPDTLVIGGRPALQYDISGVISGLRIAYLYTLADAGDTYSQVVLWSTQSKSKQYRSVFQAIANTFSAPVQGE